MVMSVLLWPFGSRDYRVWQGKVEPGFPEETNENKGPGFCQMQNEPDRIRSAEMKSVMRFSS
ncbi:MAG: hypothetical protein DI595_08155 [Agrobacterium fabrum]|uniref:Uncharacterized protein n=1 Tax=Agrobacterium fabrum TaxID=1176649 RepID=A0A2W5F8R7_9HYPH|nr:MAG: hypothetical protein DI595_08155 [Agrobacterium fabrum]